ncbi:MAG: hypothetical protein GF350_07215, partial [Chitinivibrionales bacterium]|nr:hypothetical protein [Chitinivibrionales bacterium]
LFYFVINKIIIFRSTAYSATGRELVQFVSIVVINYLLTQVIVQAIHSLTGEIYSGSVVAGVITIFFTYIVFDRIVFRTGRPRGRNRR